MSEPVGPKVVAVTGGAGGIGSTIVRDLVADGVAVVIGDYGVTLDGADPGPGPAERLAAEITEAGGQAVAHFGDVSTAKVAQGMVDVAVSTFGRLDGLVTSHGIFREGTIYDTSPEDWSAIITNHLTGTFTCVQAAMRHMRDNGGGAVVCVTSSSGMDGNPIMASYAAAKAGVTALVKSAALSGGADEINVNGIIPNAVTRVTTRPSSVSAVWWKGAAPTPALGAMATVALLGPACRHITGQVFMTSGERISRWNQSAEERAERRTDWTPQLVQESITGFMDCQPLRRFSVYGYPMPGRSGAAGSPSQSAG